MEQPVYIKLSVDRLKSELTNEASRCLAHIDADVMARYGLAIGDVVFISTPMSRSPVPARLGEPYEEDRGSNIVRLDRFLRTATKAKINQQVEIRKAGEVPELESITLMPPIDVSTAHHLVEHLSESLLENAAPLARDSVFYATFHDSAAGALYRVVKTVPEMGVVGPRTNVHIDTPQSGGMQVDQTITYEDVGGMNREITLLRELVHLPLQFPQVYRQLGINAPRGVIFYGPPGSGKTYLARALANEVEAGFYYINGPDIVGTLYGETEANLRKIFAEAAHHAPSLVLIDELDAIAPHRERSGAQSDVRIVTQLLSLLDGMLKVDGVIVIGTTNRVDAVDTALRRPGRFDREIFIGPPEAEGRLDILQVHTREMPLSSAAIGHLPAVAAITHGFVGADLMELCREAGLNALRRSSSRLQDHLAAFRFRPEQLEVEAVDFDDALARVRPSAIREAFITIPDVSWEDVGGLSEVKRQLKNNIERPLKQPEIFQKAGLSAPGGVLLYGPPGTGKTLLAKAIAKECGVNFLAMDGPEVFTKWLGESEEAIRHIFKVARQLAPSIIFFDQLDALAPRRGGESGSRTTERVVNQLLAELDGMEMLNNSVMVIAATNRMDLVDRSVLRPGRLGLHLYVGMPDRVSREDILLTELRNVELSADRRELASTLADRTEGFSGADIHAICIHAKMGALERGGYETVLPLGLEDFMGPLREIAQREAEDRADREELEGAGR
ncbi:AAA family ATPase [Candidatus Methylomirabilis sp.]|uniref:AAA family ATPase n=1 Tax=Candidatus Methylomirabilis sp. TaxID=2032687 RepID=UPI003C78329C